MNNSNVSTVTFPTSHSYSSYVYHYPKNDQGIKANDIIFRDTRRKLDTGYFFVEKVVEDVVQNSNPPGQTRTTVYARKIAYKDMKKCKGKVRTFCVGSCKLVDANYVSQLLMQEVEAARAKNEALMKILGEISDLNV